jgi:hypothetical protein
VSDDPRLDLDGVASSVGTEWAAETARSLAREKRAAAGGWPGTMSEARVRLDARLVTIASSPNAGTRERLARRTYEVARAAWRACAGPDPSQ